MGAFCCQPYRHVVDPVSFALNELDKRIERQQGHKTADQLAMQNGRFANEPDQERQRLEKRLAPQEEGTWGHTREMLAKAQSISQFAKHLHLSQRQMNDALSQFQALDADGDGVIDKREFAGILKMDPDCDETAYMFNALDVDRNGQLNYKEFMVVAAHFNSNITEQDKARFCFKMVDADNDGAVTYDELHKFLLNVLFADMEVFAKHRMQGKVDRLVTKTLGVNTYDRLNEEDFVEIVASHKDIFTPMVALYSKLHKVFAHSFDPSSTKHTNKELRQYFHRDDDEQNGKDQVEDIEYSSGAAHAAVRGSSKPIFHWQHEFQGSEKMKPGKSPGGGRSGKAHAFAAGYGDWDGNEPPKLHRRYSQDDSLHDYQGGGGQRRGGKLSGVRHVDYTGAMASDINASARVGKSMGSVEDDDGGLIFRAAEEAPRLGGERSDSVGMDSSVEALPLRDGVWEPDKDPKTGRVFWTNHALQNPTGRATGGKTVGHCQPARLSRKKSASLDEEDFAKIVKRHHAPPSSKKEKVPVAPMFKFGRYP